MRTLIIGDIHNRTDLADSAISQIPHDQVVFVGDYFDSWGDGRKQAKKTASWLKNSLAVSNRVHLWGNHDVPYCRPSISCSGWDCRKHDAVNYILKGDDWRKLKFYVWVDGWLISHAGIHPAHIPTMILGTDQTRTFLEDQNDRAEACLHASAFQHWFFNCGQIRGGNDSVSGLLWLDWNYEFAGAGFNQIVGHTPDSKTPIRKFTTDASVNYCVDGLWGGVLVLDGGRPEIWIKNQASGVFQISAV